VKWRVKHPPPSVKLTYKQTNLNEEKNFLNQNYYNCKKPFSFSSATKSLMLMLITYSKRTVHLFNGSAIHKLPQATKNQWQKDDSLKILHSISCSLKLSSCLDWMGSHGIGTCRKPLHICHHSCLFSIILWWRWLGILDKL